MRELRTPFGRFLPALSGCVALFLLAGCNPVAGPFRTPVYEGNDRVTVTGDFGPVTITLPPHENLVAAEVVDQAIRDFLASHSGNVYVVALGPYNGEQILEPLEIHLANKTKTGDPVCGDLVIVPPEVTDSLSHAELPGDVPEMAGNLFAYDKIQPLHKVEEPNLYEVKEEREKPSRVHLWGRVAVKEGHLVYEKCALPADMESVHVVPTMYIMDGDFSAGGEGATHGYALYPEDYPAFKAFVREKELVGVWCSSDEGNVMHQYALFLSLIREGHVMATRTNKSSYEASYARPFRKALMTGAGYWGNGDPESRFNRLRMGLLQNTCPTKDRPYQRLFKYGLKKYPVADAFPRLLDSVPADCPAFEKEVRAVLSFYANQPFDTLASAREWLAAHPGFDPRAAVEGREPPKPNLSSNLDFNLSPIIYFVKTVLPFIYTTHFRYAPYPYAYGEREYLLTFDEKGQPFALEAEAGGMWSSHVDKALTAAVKLRLPGHFAAQYELLSFERKDSGEDIRWHSLHYSNTCIGYPGLEIAYLIGSDWKEGDVDLSGGIAFTAFPKRPFTLRGECIRSNHAGSGWRGRAGLGVLWKRIEARLDYRWFEDQGKTCHGPSAEFSFWF